jgi:hypothetical protein
MFWTIAHISAFSIGIPFFFLLLWRKKFEGYLGLWLFVGNSLLFELLFVWTNAMKIRNLPIFHLYTLMEFSVLYFFFLSLIPLSAKKSIKIFSIGFALYLVVNPFLFEKLTDYNSISRSLESLVLIVFCSMYFYKIYKDEEIEQLENQPEFWMVCGLLIYLTVSLFTHLLANYIVKSPSSRATIMASFAFANISNIIKNIAISIGIWKANR